MRKEPVFEPVSTTKSSVIIYEQIHKMIVSGELSPGDRLPGERAMMDMFCRSRPVIREALRMLENAGLVEIIPGDGTIVKSPDSSTFSKPLENLVLLNSIPVVDLIEYRTLTEVSVVAWAAERRTEEDLKGLLIPIQKAEQIMNTDPDAFFACDVDFHYMLSKASGNQIAPLLGKPLHKMINDVLVVAFSRKTQEDQIAMCQEIVNVHYKIYDAIVRNDVEEAQRVMKVHLASFGKAGSRYFMPWMSK